MQICVLSSGSKGNVTYMEANGKKFLLDAGRNYKYINDKLKEPTPNIWRREGSSAVRGF